MRMPNCGREFDLNRMWQKFCSKQCQQKWNHDRYRADKLEDGPVFVQRKPKEDHPWRRWNGRANGNDDETPAERQKATGEARMVIERMMAGPRIHRRL
jgi:hypothetical protein